MRIFRRMFFRPPLLTLLAALALAHPVQAAEPVVMPIERAGKTPSTFDEYTSAAEQLVDEALLARVTEFIRDQGHRSAADELRRLVESFEHDRALVLLRLLAEQTGVESL